MIGRNGKYMANAERDFHVWHGMFRRKQGVELDTTDIDVTMWNEHSLIEQAELHPCFAPHEVLATLWKAGPKVWSECILGPGGERGVAEFWKHERRIRITWGDQKLYFNIGVITTFITTMQ